MKKTPYLINRFISRIEKVNSCWLWTGALNNKGYGSISLGKRGELIVVHRFAYELMVGPIPKDLTIDHLCKVRNCVNPYHLEAVTFKENILRGTSPSAIHAKKQTCPKGHSYDWINKQGARGCRKCNREWQKNNRIKKLKLKKGE